MIEWKITKLETKPLLDGLPEVVVCAEWICSVKENNQSAECNGFVNLPPVNPMQFTPYSDLTEVQVLDWLWNSCINKNQIEQIVTNQLNEKLSPNPEVPPLPWN